MKLHELGMLAGMSFRNLGRHRVKTVITVIAVAVSVTLYIFMDGWLLGMTLESERNIVAYETGAAKIQTQAYFDKKDDLPMYESFGNWEPLARVLEDAGYDSAPRFEFTGTLHAANGSAPVLCTGVDVTRERRLLRYPDYLDSGRFPAAGAYEIALGMLTADKLGLAVPRRMDAEKFDRFIETIAPDPSDAARIGACTKRGIRQTGKSGPLTGMATATLRASRSFISKPTLNRRILNISGTAWAVPAFLMCEFSPQSTSRPFPSGLTPPGSRKTSFRGSLPGTEDCWKRSMRPIRFSETTFW